MERIGADVPVRGEGSGWAAPSVKALRRHLGASQRVFAGELGVRQQTVSEWETGVYRPRGASARLLSLVAERAGFRYGADLNDPRRVDPAEDEAGTGHGSA